MKRRASGVLLHVTSLPSTFGIGDLGPEAHRFVDFLAETKQGFWQILPLHPVPAGANSPYQALSAFAGNPLLISLEHLVRDGLLDEGELGEGRDFPGDRVDFEKVRAHRAPLFRAAFDRFREKGGGPRYEEFCWSQGSWLDDHALFTVLKGRHGGKPWNRWPKKVRHRSGKALLSARQEMADGFEMERFLQYIFFRQWADLRAYALGRGIQIIGDMPIYMDYDSADVWSRRDIFKLDENGDPEAVSGVPPDYFSETGQLWGNPVYRWEILQETGFDWWADRLRHNLAVTDWLRLDHFRGLVSYWEVPAGETTAINGTWVDVPVMAFFERMLREFPCLPIIAEDLGTITADVREIIHRFDLPGMKVLLFAFGDDFPAGPYLPHNLTKNAVVYTGTHDNNTVRGWFENEAGEAMKERLFAYLGREISAGESPWALIRLAMMSVARLAVFPMQDILGLGEDARMNHPAGGTGNWEWRLPPGQPDGETRDRLRELTVVSGRGGLRT